MFRVLNALIIYESNCKNTVKFMNKYYLFIYHKMFTIILQNPGTK